MKLNFLNNISLIKIAGIKNILTLEVFDSGIKVALFQRKENILKINTRTSLNDFSIIFNECSGGNLQTLPSILKKYIEMYKLKDIYILIGINECLFQKIKIPVEVEDDELWFLEHNENYIPEGKSSDEFVYAYKKIISDDRFRHYFVITARKDYVEKIAILCSPSGVNILAAFPFSTSLLTSQVSAGSSSLLLVFLNNKLQYVRKDEENFFDFGEVYYSSEKDDLATSSGLPSHMSGALDKLFHLFMQAKQINNINIFLSGPQDLNALLRSYILNNISMDVSFIDNHLNSEFLHHALAVNNLFENIDSVFNLLPSDRLVTSRNFVEKKIWLNITLAAGTILLLLLICSNLFSSLLKNTQSNLDNEKTTLTLYKEQLKHIKDENANYKSNLAILYKLKDKKDQYSNLLRSLTEITNARSCLTDIEINNDDSNLNIVISGLSYSQTDVSDLIKRLESIKLYSNIALIYSSIYTPEESSANSNNENKRLIKFSLRYDYDAN